MGNYDRLSDNQLQLPNVDYICFTDNKWLKSSIWNVIYVDPFYTDSNRSAKIYKILPHKFLPNEYDKSVWIDGNFSVTGDFRGIFNGNSNHYTFDHSQTKTDRWDCLYKEYEVCLRLLKDDPNIMKRQIDKYKREGYPKNNGLACSGVLLRNHKNDKLKYIMEEWWNEIKNNSKRDQLSFNYITWKYNYEFTYLTGEIRNNKYFKKINNHIK